MFIDTHTHLFLEQFDNDRPETIQRAIDAGVLQMILPDIDSSTTEALFRMAADFPDNCFPAVGLHPSSVKANYRTELAQVEKNARQRKVYAIGEIGIDLYWDKTFVNEQIIAFETQCRLAAQLGLPVIIHTREAFDQVFASLDKVYSDKLHGVFHSFTGNLEQAQKALSYNNFFVGLGGIVTFKNGGVNKVLPHIPLERIVLETDSPYLAPTPHRGKRNETAYLGLVAQKIAEIKAIDIKHVERITTANAQRLFQLPAVLAH